MRKLAFLFNEPDIFYYIDEGNVQEVESFIQKENNLNLKRSDGCNLVIAAILAKNTEIVKKIVEAGADLYESFQDLNALQTAIKIQHTEIAEYLRTKDQHTVVDGMGFGFALYGASY